MAPNLTGSATGLFLAGAEVISDVKQQHQQHQAPVVVSSPQSKDTSSSRQQRPRYHWQIVWRNVIAFVFLHATTVYTFYIILSGQMLYRTILFSLFYGFICGMGITAGAHRLWAHKAYKARWPLRLALSFCQAAAFQNHIYEWVRDHRAHHKFCDTDADPHNSKRGFFFCHMGWLMVKKQKAVMEKGKTIDMSDLERDWVVMFQKKYYLILMPLLCFVLPTVIPWYFWGEKGWIAWYATVLRYTVSLNSTWLVNSAAHMWGMKPYDKNISPVENLTVAILAFGEGWHNYHHAFPWDYKTSEYGLYRSNVTAGVIDFMAKIGMAYDLKVAPEKMILARAKRTGDGSRIKDDNKTTVEETNPHEGEVWGWGDADMTKEDQSLIQESISCKKSK